MYDKTEKYHHIYCVLSQINLAPALLEQKSQFISKEHNITTLINEWDDLNLLPAQLDLIVCILTKKKIIMADPNVRFLEWPAEHVKSADPHADPEFIKSNQLPQK